MIPQTSSTVVVSVGRNGADIQGVWPGWPLAITLIMFTDDASHPANKEISKRVAELYERPNDKFAVGNLEHALQDWGFIVLDDPFAFQDEISALEYFELLQDECRTIMRGRLIRSGPMTYGPFVLRDGPFVERDPYALTTRR